MLFSFNYSSFIGCSFRYSSADLIGVEIYISKLHTLSLSTIELKYIQAKRIYVGIITYMLQ